MAYQWSIGDIWKEKFDQVYRLSLKTLLNKNWKNNYYVKVLSIGLKIGESPRGDKLLKCLAHYSTDPDNLIDFEELESEMCNKDKILLLLDGYDEIAHLKTSKLKETSGEYKRLFKEIFSHKYVILTSRPNTVDKEMREEFDRNIENTGLDQDGIKQYFEQYF